uniref:Rho guanine nucleotide exchange factor (GEF) 28a n=1 Tax=Periophthalmus magnuspinnatus TaxID=409849 RepID=A0A3B4AFS5_9GOBI
MSCINSDLKPINTLFFSQDLAEHLIIHGHRLRATDHEELSSLFSLGQGSSRWAMDRCIALAMANLDIPHSWNVLGSQSVCLNVFSEHTPRESPLHLAVRFGLCRLAELLLCQPGGLMAINLPNEERVTPLQLAQNTGNSELLDPPNPLTTPPAGLSQVWVDHSRLLRFCHDTKNLTLTVRQNLRWSSEESRHADILLLRNRLHDEDFLREVNVLLFLFLRLNRIEDEEWDRYIIPSKAESEKYKVSRTFSFLKSRMTSTRSKTKVNVKEIKDKGTVASGHQFAPMSPSGSALCVACDKFVSGKELLHCSSKYDTVKAVVLCVMVFNCLHLLKNPLIHTAAMCYGLGGSLLGDLSADELGLDAESWSLAVSPDFCRQHERFTVKRQDVIYELLQTELHHIQTLTVMSEVFRRGMLEELQLDLDCVVRVFPCLDPLIHFHKNLFGALQERRRASAKPQQPHNYLIHNIGDILLQQFSDENAEKMKQMYGEFCSHHKEAVNIFKDLQQQNKKLQNFVKSNNILVKRREVPEFILLVTQRITKYPVLLERILQYTKRDQEYQDLSSALVHIRDIISAVDMTVNKYEKSQELQEVLNRLENKSIAKLKNGKVFSKQDLCSKHRVLQHKGLVYWKTATGRLKDTLALLLTDVLVFLQEKDQRFTFAAVDQKPPVIPLQKLIVREVANEERGMFLISASSVGPEMYEVHTISREERNAWMRQIRQAVESCPEEEEEEERSNESEETKRATEARIQKITQFQETLLAQDQMICNTLEEKLELYAELTELSLGSPEPIPHRHLLVQVDSDAPRLASTLLTAALKEAENLMSVLQSRDGAVVQSPHYTGVESNSEDSVQDVPSERESLLTRNTRPLFYSSLYTLLRY